MKSGEIAPNELNEPFELFAPIEHFEQASACIRHSVWGGPISQSSHA
jgi:hypothetical protein